MAMPKQVRPTDPATKPTQTLLATMLAERMVGDEMKLAIIHEAQRGLMQAQASKLIEFLATYRLTPEAAKARENDDPVTEPGFYKHEGREYEVVTADAGHLYPVDVETGRFAKGLFPRLRASERVARLKVVG